LTGLVLNTLIVTRLSLSTPMMLSDALLGFLKRIEFLTKARFMIFDYTYSIFGKHEVKKKKWEIGSLVHIVRWA